VKQAQQEHYLFIRHPDLRGRRIRQAEPEHDRTGAGETRQLRRELYGIFAPYCRREKDA